MDTDEHKALVRRFLDVVWHQGDLAAIGEFYADAFVGENPGAPGGMRGPEGMRQLVATFRAAFPDVRFTVEDQVAEGDRVVTRWTARGTQQGDLPGLPATGRPARVPGITASRMVGGKIVEEWAAWDQLGLLQQLGALPGPGQPPTDDGA